MRGRKPTATAILKLTGAYRKDRHGERAQLPPGIPDCPGVLSPVARAEWERLVPELAASGVLTLVDRGILAAHCQAYATWIEAEQMMAQHGRMATSSTGWQTPSVWHSIGNAAFGRMIKTAAELGLTPVSRGRVKATPKQADGDSSRKRFFRS